jgi:hypothetical protein
MQGLPSSTLLWGVVVPLLILGVMFLPGRQPKNLVIFAFDGLQARHLAVNGTATTTAPALGQFFNESYVFVGTEQFVTRTDEGFADVLVTGTTTLASLLYEHGYTTAAFTGGGEHLAFDMMRVGFETYYAPDTVGNYAGSVPRALEWVAQRPRAKDPFFLFVHGNDLAREVPEAEVGALIARTDLEFATFMRGLNTQQKLGTTVVMVVVHDGASVVPLAVRVPSAAYTRVETLLSPRDVVPILFQLLEVYSTSTATRTDRRIL